MTFEGPAKDNADCNNDKERDDRDRDDNDVKNDVIMDDRRMSERNKYCLIYINIARFVVYR